MTAADTLSYAANFCGWPVVWPSKSYEILMFVYDLQTDANNDVMPQSSSYILCSGP